MMTKEQLREAGLFDARVPRYTSYPTAPHFSADVGAEDFARWLARLTPGSEISLYVHIPFCRRLCWYCACRTQGVKNDRPVKAYLDLLLQEIEMVRQHAPEGVRLQRLHWGGGTPTILGAADIRRLAGAIRDAFPFADEAEFSVEIDPNEIDAARLDALAEAGMNRASIGIQDFDPVIQEAIGRPQGFALTREAAEALRARGIRSLNADIVYGLPYQTPERMERTVRQLLELDPDRIAMYGYAHVPWMAKRQVMIPEEALPGSEQRLALFELASGMFEEAGFLPIGIDHFARPGDGLAEAFRARTLRRNFQGYTDDQAAALIGLGASSVSRLPEGYAQNAAATAAWQQRVGAGELATSRGHAFSTEDRLRARIIEELMCFFEVDFAGLEAAFGDIPASVIADRDRAIARFSPFVHFDGNVLAIDPEVARPLARLVAFIFDAYGPGGGGHSRAI